MEKIFSEIISHEQVTIEKKLLAASKILEEANKRVDNLYKKAELEVEETLKVAYQTGLNLGKEQAIKKIFLCERLYFKTIERGRGEIIRLAAKIAREVIGEAYSQNAGLIVDRVNNLIKQVQNSHLVKIFIRAEEYKIIENKFIESKKDLNGNIQLEIDNTLKIGDLRIESEHGILEAKIDNFIESFVNYAKKFIGSSFKY